MEGGSDSAPDREMSSCGRSGGERGRRERGDMENERRVCYMWM